MDDSSRPRFHLAFPVRDLDEARDFYGGLLGCPEGRSSDRWVDFDLRGHQIVAHLVEGGGADVPHGQVDGKAVPVRHFGLILDPGEWRRLADRVTGRVDFAIEPGVRFEGTAGEQWTMFFTDPSGNALEFKAFADEAMVFAPFDTPGS